MMNLFMGERVFRRGLKDYLKKYKYGNADQDDLWHALTQAAYRHSALPRSLTIKKIMDTWTLQAGYPVIMVNRDYRHGTATITQV